jgi:ParB family chromosome partitioning protein
LDEIMTESQTVSIALSHLKPSAHNVRQSAADNIESLAHSILSQGVLQNLVVVGTGTKGTYEVVAGGRRLAAMKQLQKQGKIKATFLVPCKVIAAEEAVTASLTENVERKPMHPADEFVAFHTLIDAGKSIEDVAAAFSVAPVVVKRRLKLANVSPRLLALYRHEDTSGLNLECLMAFALTDDHERQEKVWESLSKHYRSAHAIREALTETELRGDDRLVRFVGLKAYQKAGGPIREDLFSEPAVAYVQDADLLRTLAQAKLAKKADEIRDEEGAAWAEARLQFDYAERSAFGCVGTVRKTPTAKQQERIDALKRQLDELDAAEGEEAWEQAGALSEQLNEIEQRLMRPDPKAARLAGIVVTVGHDGRAQILRGLVKPEDKKELKALAKSEAEGGGETSKDEATDDETSSLSGALRATLAAHYTAALQTKVEETPGVALRALTAALWHSVGGRGQSFDRGVVQAHGAVASLHGDAPELPTAVAGQLLATTEQNWTQRLAGISNLFEHLQGVDAEEVLSLLAHCTARFVDCTGQRPRSDAAGPIAKACGLDMREFWKPTAEAFLKRVPKSVILEALREVNATLDLAPFERARKAELVSMAEPILVKARWLPSMLRTG